MRAFASGTTGYAPVRDVRPALPDFRTTFDPLSPVHREVFFLLGASELSCEEAAEVMDVSVVGVQSWTSRNLAELIGFSGLHDGKIRDQCR
jgi:DNA-directed RNA polymerase specialized sigma24 family protein